MACYKPQGTQLLTSEIDQVRREMDELRQRVIYLENLQRTTPSAQPVMTSGMMSPKFMTRAWSV